MTDLVRNYERFSCQPPHTHTRQHLVPHPREADHRMSRADHRPSADSPLALRPENPAEGRPRRGRPGDRSRPLRHRAGRHHPSPLCHGRPLRQPPRPQPCRPPHPPPHRRPLLLHGHRPRVRPHHPAPLPHHPGDRDRRRVGHLAQARDRGHGRAHLGAGDPSHRRQVVRLLRLRARRGHLGHPYLGAGELQPRSVQGDLGRARADRRPPGRPSPSTPPPSPTAAPATSPGRSTSPAWTTTPPCGCPRWPTR